LQGGEISVTSDVHGTTFSFYFRCPSIGNPSNVPIEKYINDELPSQTLITLPIPATAEAKVQINQILIEPPSGPPKNHGTERSPKKTLSISRAYNVVLVEDNLVNQRVMQRQLERIGCRVLVCNHGVEALEALRASRIHMDTIPTSPDTYDVDVILMDVEMPVMDGLTATREIRNMRTQGLLTKHVPIIAITANARPEQIQDVLTSGGDMVLNKPFTVKELTKRLDGILGHVNNS